MRDGSRWAVLPVFLIRLLLTRVQAASEVGSNLAPAPSPGSIGCFLDDRCTLLSFKKQLVNQGEPELASWDNSNNLTFWKGVTWQVSADGAQIFVEKLELGGLHLENSIYPLLQEGLSFLTTLNISGNNFTGHLPPTLRMCSPLQVLDLSNNSFFGPLPQAVNCLNTVNDSSPLSLAILSSAVNLRFLNLSENLFTGQVPSSLLQSLPSLSHINLQHNRLVGELPNSLENCTQLVELRLSDNNFTGISFNVLGKLPLLEVLQVTNNNISAELVLPAEVGMFRQLRSLSLSDNHFWGHVPESLGNFSNLDTLELKNNLLTGSIPSSLGKLSRLRILSLQFNSLNGTIPTDFSQLSNLSSLSLNHNKLTGSIVPQLANCTGLRSLWLSENYLAGPVPRELGNFTNLVVFSLYGNYFTGPIPAEVGNLSNVVAFDFSWNHLDSEIPSTLCNFYQLQVLLLNNNRLSGSIPSCIGNYSHLRILDISHNKLSGNIPTDLSNLTALASISEQGPPSELSSATYIQDLLGHNLVWELSESPTTFFIHNNTLSGPIPPAFGLLQKLQQLNLRNNLLSGEIPSALGNASNLLSLDLSFNSLGGPIPVELLNLNFLSFLNLSYNNLSGSIPVTSQFSTFGNKSFLGNPFLCSPSLGMTCSGLLSSPAPHIRGGAYKRPLSKKLLPLYIILASAIVCSLFLGGLFAWTWVGGHWQKSSLASDGDDSENKDDFQVFHVTISSALPCLSPKELAYATDHYNENNIIGDGGFGLVYRAVLHNGAVVAVKKQIEDGAQGQNEFLAEMRTLGKIKHRNLVCLLGYCAYGKERILVYEYMKNGSLDSWLHCRDEGVASLDWRTRLKIARGAAEGLAYLHHGLIPSIIHRDIKASNILLDCQFEARLADFGLARSTRADESHVSTDFAGTAGYIPPEYSQATAATTKGDVYSFGVVLLEILTGRRPTDPFFRKKEMAHVVTWVLGMSMEDAIEKTLDLSSSASTDEMLEFMRIACLCCQETPSKRPNMGEVVRMLETLERQQSPSRSPSVVLYEEAMSPRCR